MAVRREAEEPDVRFTLANERTFLAWMRTPVAFLAASLAADVLKVGDSEVLRRLPCLTLGILGLVSVVHDWISWARTERAIRREDPLPRHRAPIAVVAMATVAWRGGPARHEIAPPGSASARSASRRFGVLDIARLLAS